MLIRLQKNTKNALLISEMCELEKSVKECTMNLLIVQQTFKHNVYILRAQGEEDSLFKDVIDIELEAKFKDIHLRI